VSLEGELRPCPGCKEDVPEFGWCDVCGLCADCCSHLHPAAPRFGFLEHDQDDDSDMENERYYWD
jgi:hypothetical protein